MEKIALLAQIICLTQFCDAEVSEKLTRQVLKSKKFKFDQL